MEDELDPVEYLEIKRLKQEGAFMAGQENRQSNERADYLKSTAQVYRDVPAIDINQLDVLEQMHAHLSQLEDLHSRLRFVMTEVRSLVAKR